MRRGSEQRPLRHSSLGRCDDVRSSRVSHIEHELQPSSSIDRRRSRFSLLTLTNPSVSRLVQLSVFQHTRMGASVHPKPISSACDDRTGCAIRGAVVARNVFSRQIFQHVAFAYVSERTGVGNRRPPIVPRSQRLPGQPAGARSSAPVEPIRCRTRSVRRRCTSDVTLQLRRETRRLVFLLGQAPTCRRRTRPDSE